jgi:uncharacterized protein YbbK (DUF523 family)
MIRVLVSACLLGQPVRYDGKVVNFHNDVLDRWMNEGRLVPVCPETAAGLPVPRTPFEISGGDGDEVWSGRARVVRQDGEDVSALFIQGAEITLNLAKARNAWIAVMKERSPSCGSNTVYDGTFRGRKVAGAGVAAALLRRNGILVFSEVQIEDAAEALARFPMERSRS